MRARRIQGLISVLLCVLAASGRSPAWAGVTGYAAARGIVDRACRQFSAYDRDGDGQYEIASLKRLDSAAGSGKGLVLVFVESRLLAPPPAGKPPVADLRPALRQYVRDLGREGCQAFLLEASLYGGPRHQDGLTVLALRDMLRAVWKDAPDLKAAVLVGNFPAAFLVRQYYWQRDDGLTLFAGTPAQKSWNAVRHVRSLAEPVASPCDLILADLDGHWDQCYQRAPQRVGGLLAAFPDDPKREVSGTFQYTGERYEDFFLVQDGFWEEAAAPDGKRKFTFPGEPNDECTDADRKQVNIMARPEIAIGRINAVHAGVVPNPAVRGVRGESLLDSSGRPQAVEFADEKSVPGIPDLWVRSPVMERRLLVEYFDRNHRYRTGGYRDGLLPASIATEWDSSVPEMERAVPGWKGASTDGLDLHGSKVSVADFVSWIKRPALARAIKAHSGPWGCYFAGPPDPAAYDQATGQTHWFWTRQGKQLVPTMKGAGGGVDYGTLRTLYENHVLPDTPCLYFHTGCEIIMPQFYETEPYSSPRYAMLQAGEAFLMLGNGLAFVGRGKVFYDEPREFWNVMGKGGTWGDGWKHYFDVEGADAEVAKDGIGRKRAYFWSTLGDCTLTLPAGLLGAAPPKQARR